MLGLHRRNLVLVYSHIAAVIAGSICCSVSRAAEPPEVRGVLATRVTFDDDVSEKLATASLELLANCSMGQAASEREWADADRGCHLRLRFIEPRTVSISRPASARSGLPEKAEVSEMILTFPLGSGRVWIRSGDEYAWYAKWPGLAHTQLCNPIQLLLREASPAE